MLIDRANSNIGERPYHLLLPFTLVWLIKPYYQGTGLDWAALAIAWPVFFALYVLAHARMRSHSVAGLISLTLLGAMYVPLNPEASGIFAFVAAVIASRSFRPRVLWSYLVGINLLLVGEALFFHLNLWTWIGGGGGAILFAQYVLLNTRERDTNVQLRLAQDEIGRLAKLAERERITRDLHDVLGHTLSLIAMKSELAQKRFSTDPLATLLEAQQIEMISRGALIRVREVIHCYATAPFAEEVNRVANALASIGLGVQCNLNDVALNSMQESVFAMVLQEASTNIIRHARAGSCRIELVDTGNWSSSWSWTTVTVPPSTKASVCVACGSGFACLVGPWRSGLIMAPTCGQTCRGEVKPDESHISFLTLGRSQKSCMTPSSNHVLPLHNRTHYQHRLSYRRGNRGYDCWCDRDHRP